ncbi:MAG: hypothetical protein ACXVB9_07125 [Bdellovibrionota bacterium]
MKTMLVWIALLAASPAFAARVTEEGQKRCGVVELKKETIGGRGGPSSISVPQLRVGEKLYQIVFDGEEWTADSAEKNQRARAIIDRLGDGQRLCLTGEVSDVDGTDPMKDGTGIWIFPSSASLISLRNPEPAL